MSEKISFEEFKRVRLVVGKITSAERLEGARKLLVLKVDIGSEERQLVAGIAEYYKPEELVGKNIVVVANLQPKVIRGRKSEGMLLAAVHDGVPVLLIPEKDVPPGTPVE
ncbi:MAG: methionine--tRNA ligase subunit beta [Thermoproteales archaeon]|nr:methionine--tRNA ligase subunit beta [Thermoproteales archaeon]